jgi:hypothetical protein
MKRDLNGILQSYVRIVLDIQLKRAPLNYIHTINFVWQYDLSLQQQKRLNPKHISDDEPPTIGCGNKH